MNEINHEMLELTKKLVEIPSVNTTSGEKDIAVFIEQYLRQIPYFKKHPDQVIIQHLKDDVLDRRNVFALILGEKQPGSDTFMLHGHIDTVGVEDFGALEQYAFSPDSLLEQLNQMELTKEIKDDIASNDYLFGRGSCDMKSGDAVFLVLMKELSERVEQLSGNILISLNPVEENLHTGIIEGLDVLEELQKKYGLDYKLAINNDFICPLYPGDSTITIYTGTVGKLLPCFYIQGKETHVGQCFEGFDASKVASKILDRIHLNCDFSDGFKGEYSYPPSVLKIKDLKPWYNVQTAKEAFIYFNFFVHNASMEEVTNKLLNTADAAMKETFQELEEQAKKFSNLNGQPIANTLFNSRVISYAELLEMAKNKDASIVAGLDEITHKCMEDGVDKREIPIKLIRKLLHFLEITEPIVVLYYAAPYCPHNTLQGENEHYVREIEKIAKKVGIEENIDYRMMRFFPSLSDSSYIKIDDIQESIDLLLNNFPEMEILYPVPIEKIQRLNIPAVNYGCYGKDAHKWTERVNIPYTFGVLPKLITETIFYYLS